VNKVNINLVIRTFT